MKLTEDILHERLQVDDILHSGAIIDLLSNVVCKGSKELLITLAEQNGLESLMADGDRVMVLNFFIDLATVLINSYDERLGIMSALVYLLCERDRYSIDLQWGWRDMRRFEMFILWLEPLLHHKSARSLLLYILNNFPPLRVTPRMLQALIDIAPSLLRELSFDCDAKLVSAADLAQTTDIIASICYFGVGLEIREILKTDLIIYDFYYPKIKDMRCSHSHCELVRMTRKAIKDRNESPIVENTDLARKLMATLGRSEFMAQALNVTKLITCLGAEDADDRWTLEKDDALLNFFTIYHVWELSNQTPAFEDVVGRIEALDAFIIEHRYLERYLSLSKEGGRGGLPRGLGLWSVYYLRRLQTDVKVFDSLSVAWLQLFCERVAEVRNTNMIPFDDGFLLPFVACLYTAYKSSLQLRPDRAACEDHRYLCADEFVCTWSSKVAGAVAQALGTMVGLVDAHMLSSLTPVPKDKFSRHLLFLSCCFGIVCGVGEYGKIPELRRPVILPAAAACGLLTDVCRTFLKMVTEHSSCVMIRRIAEISLMRAEQASGLRLVLA